MEISPQQELKIVASMDLSQGSGSGAGGEEFPEAGAGVEHRVVIGTWEVTMRWLASAARGPMELVIRAAPGTPPESVERGITVDTLRSIPLAHISREVEAMSGMVQRMEREDFFSETVEKIAHDISRAALAVRRPGRAGRPDGFLALVAAIYSWYVDLGYSDPVRKVEEATGCNWRVVANWVRLARKREMLAQASPGRPGGILTARAVRILEAQEYRFSEILGQYFLKGD